MCPTMTDHDELCCEESYRAKNKCSRLLKTKQPAHGGLYRIWTGRLGISERMTVVRLSSSFDAVAWQ